MNSPEKILKAQRSLSVYSGTKMLALWLIAASGVLCAVELGEALAQHESVLRALSSGALIVVVAVLLRDACTKRILEVQRSLQRNHV